MAKNNHFYKKILMSKKSNQPVGAVDPVAVVVCPPAFPVSGILSTGKCNIISKITLLD